MAIGRSAESKANNTATEQNASYYDNSQNSYNNAQTDAGDFEKQLSTYKAANPYGAGGEFQTATNQELSNTAGSSARSAGEALQAQALRTGGNTDAAIAATEQMQQANERNLGADEASATQKRIGDQAAYNQSVLNATAQPVAQQTQLAGQQGQLGEGALNSAINAGKTPTWMDELGGGIAEGLGKAIGGGGSTALGKVCWIAAELYGGWNDPRTIAVRGWLTGDFSRTLLGRAVLPLYRTFGEQVAELVRKYKPMRALFLPLFNLALKKASRG